MATQTINGKAFEYACLLELYNAIENKENVNIVRNDALQIAYGFYQCMADEDRSILHVAASKASRLILKLEPNLWLDSSVEKLDLQLQEDAAGQIGDVRDVLLTRSDNGWEIGVSCKHNHDAVKHSRLSQNIDFGDVWLNRPCSEEYFDDIRPIFTRLAELRKQGVLWNDVEDKIDGVYKPVLNAFVKELRLLDLKYPGEIPGSLVKYLIGKKDFYKIIARENERLTQIQAYNIYGTLNKSIKGFKAKTKLNKLPLPTKFFNISYKNNENGSLSDNTIEITFDKGWAVSMRIHSASSKVEASLKFDVQIIGYPRDLFNRDVEWD